MHRLTLVALASLAAATLAGPGHAAGSEAGSPGVCIANGTDTEYLFVAETRGGDRVLRRMAPGETLCSETPGAGVVSVFVSEDEWEGCSRLVGAGQTETLLRFVDVDRCEWSDHRR